MSSGGPAGAYYGIKKREAPTGPVTLNILLAGSSGVPGRNILQSLLGLWRSESAKLQLRISIIKRAGTDASAQNGNPPYDIVYVDDFSNIPALARIIESKDPDVIISALNAEPTPTLDNHLIDAVSGLASKNGAGKKQIFFINGFTLDLLHPSVPSSLSAQALQTISAKINFAHRLQALSMSGEIQYCTVVCAAFLDYCLVKGYVGVNLGDATVTLIDKGDFVITGCSLKFVGDAVAHIVRQYAIGSDLDRSEVINQRLRIAETPYSGKSLLAAVEKATGEKFDVEQKTSAELLQEGSVIGYLNWGENGASTFMPDGLGFGRGTVLDAARRSLDEIVQQAIKDGAEAFEGVGR